MRKYNLSLKRKALIGIIIILLPVIITFLIVYNQNRTYLKQRILDTMTVIAESYEGQVYQFLEKTKTRAQDFASDGFIRTQLQKAVRGNTSGFSKLNKHLIKNKIVLDKTINAVSILSLEGRVVASTDKAKIGKELSKEDCFVKGQKSTAITESRNEHTGLPEIRISTPIFAKETGRPIGVLVNCILISELNRLLVGEYVKELGAVSWGKGRGAWKTLEIYLVNRDKRMITESIFVKDAVLKQTVDTPPVNLGLTSNKEMSGFYKDYRGKEVVGVSMYFPSMKWVLLVEIDRDEVLAPVRYILINTLITVVVVMGIIVLIYIAFAKKIVKPLHIVSNAIKDIARDNIEIIVPVQTGDEIGTLCESFNSMSRDIKSRTTELKKSNERLAEAQQIAHIGNWEWDLVKNEAYWSDELHRIFGFAPQEFVVTYDAFLNRLHPDDREFVKKSVDDALHGKNPYDIEFRIFHKDGSVRIIHEKGVVTFDHTGRAIRMVGTVQDITELKRAIDEIYLLQTMSIAVSASGNLHDALVMVIQKICNFTGWVYGEAWNPNPDGTLLERDHAYYSSIEGFEKFSAITEGMTFPSGIGLPGRAWSEKQPVWIQDVTVDPYYLRAQIAREVGLKTGIAFPITTDNEVVSVIVFYDLKTKEKDERIMQLVLTVLSQIGSIVKRKQAEDALRASEEKLRSILDNATAVIYVKDLQGRFLFINRQYMKLFSLTEDAVKGKTDLDLWPKELAEAFQANDRRVIESKTPIEFEEAAPHDDGLHTYISVKFPLFDVNGTVYAVCGVSTDITEHKRADDLLIERSRLAALGAEVGFSLAQKDTLHDMLQKCADAFVRNLNVAFARIWTINKEENVLELQSSAGIYTHIDGPHSRVPVGKYKIGLIAGERKPYLTNAVISDPRVHDQEWAKKTGMVAFAGYPLMIEDHIVGVMAMFSTKPITETAFEALASVSDMIALGIERKRTEEKLEKYGILFSEIMDLAYIYDTKGNILFVNKVFEKLTGHKPESFFGKSFAPLFDEENLEKATDVYARTLKGESPQYELYFKDTGKLCEYKNIPLEDGKGNVIGVMGVARDITMRKHMEDQLRTLSYTVEQSSVPIVITNTHGDIQYVNPMFTRLTGYSMKEAIGKNPRILKSGKTPPEIYKQLWDTITKGDEWHGEFCNKKKNGELYWEYAHISSIKDPMGRITNFVGIIEDITERRQMEEVERKLREQLYHVQKLESVGTLAGGIAHDFNNILTAIIGYANLVQMEMKEDVPSRDFVQKILNSAEKAAHLTQGLLAFSRKQISSPKPVYLNEIIKGVKSLLVRIMREDIKIKTTLTDKECVLMADVGQMEQVLMNLATNARDAMPKGGVLSIITDILEVDNEFIKAHGYGEVGRYALVSVSDTGEGMDEKTKERIFEPFFTTKELGKGTGLGLAIVYGIIKQHNGYINVYSEPGKGTTFRIYLPLVEAEVERKKPEVHVVHMGGTETILIAEDDEDIRKLTKTVLEGHGYTVIEAVDGQDAVEKFSANKDKIHLLLFDVMMPNKNGREAYDAINEMKPGINALFMSGYREDVVYKKNLPGKELPLIAKPVSPTELLKKVREALDK